MSETARPETAHDRRLQAVMGALLCITSAVLIVPNIATLAVSMPFLHTLYQIEVLPFLIIAPLGALSIASRRRIARVFQVLVLLVVGWIAALEMWSGNLTGFIFIVFGLLLAWEYDLLAAYATVKVAIVSAIYLGAMAVNFFVISDNLASQFASNAAGAVALSFLVWLLVAARIRDEVRRSQQLERTVAERTDALEQALAEYKLLLAELHHRTKNNLQIVASILSLDSTGERAIADEISMRSLRLNALARVHDQLYAATGGGEVDLGGFVDNYLDSARTLAAPAPFEVSCRSDLSETVSSDLAIRLGLVLNEIVMNTVEHAVQNHEVVHLSVSISQHDGHVRMETADDGPGYSESATEGVGSQIVAATVERMGGRAISEVDHGVHWQIEVPIEFGRTKWESISVGHEAS